MQLIVRDLYLKKMKMNLKNNVMISTRRVISMAKEKVVKTNAMRILDSKKVN